LSTVFETTVGIIILEKMLSHVSVVGCFMRQFPNTVSTREITSFTHQEIDVFMINFVYFTLYDLNNKPHKITKATAPPTAK
jgi:hypothetical protein